MIQSYCRSVPIVLLAIAFTSQGGAEQSVVLESKDLRATVDLATLSVDVRHLGAGVDWRMSREADREFVFEKDGKIHEVRLADARVKRVTRLGDGAAVIALEDLRLEILLRIDQESGELVFHLVPLQEDHSFKIKGIIYPRPFDVPMAADSYSFFPYHQGVLIPGNWRQAEDINNPIQFDDDARQRLYGELMGRPGNWWDWIESDQAGNVTHAKMACFGAVQPRSGFLAIIDDRCQMDTFMHVRHSPGRPTSYRIYWRPVMGAFGYPRVIRYRFEKDAGYVSLMRHYRRHAENLGYAVTLAEKTQANPKLEALKGAVNLGTQISVHDKRTFTHRVVNSFDAVGDMVADFKQRTGVDRASISFTGWQRYGHDQEYPDINPPMMYAGGPKGLTELAEKVKKLGYIFGLRTDNYCDITLDSASFDEEVTLKDSRGKYFRRSTWAAGVNSLICPMWAMRFLRRNFEVGRMDYPPVHGLLKTALPDFYLLGNYVTNWECYDARHPLTRNENRRQLAEIFQYFQSKRILLTIEHHIDWAAPYIFSARTRASHSGVYGEDRAGPNRGIPVPLWQLVFHDCTYVTGDDLLYALLWGAQASLNLPMPSTPDRVNDALLLAKLHRAVGWDRMTDHRFLSDDYQVQETAFSSGAKVWVDFKQKRYRISGVPGIEPVERQADSLRR